MDYLEPPREGDAPEPQPIAPEERRVVEPPPLPDRVPLPRQPPPLPNETPADLPPTFFGPGYAKGRRSLVTLGLVLILGGMAALFCLAMVEQQWRDNLTWGYALAGPVVGEPPEDAIPTLIRPVPLDNFPEQAQLVGAINTLIAMDAGEGGPSLDFDNTEALLMAEIPREDLEGMLADGRLPEPGKPEVLAGDLCRAESFHIDSFNFTVVGHLKPGVGGLTFTYVLPRHSAWEPMFDQHDDTLRAWIVPEGKLNAAEVFVDAGLMKEEDLENPAAMMDVQEALSVYEGSHLHPMTRTLPPLAAATALVLMVMLLGITLATTHALLLIRPNAPGYMRALCEAVAEGTRGWYAVHLICYGTFAALMLMGVSDARGNMQIIEVVKQQFTEGDLAYIGKAYLSGNVLAAANATWVNNYLLQTVALATGISVIPPLGLGFFKTLVSLAIVGFAMAPVWTDIIGNYVLHSGTMVLELEPYVLVAWTCIFWPIRLVQGLRARDSQRIGRWLLVMLQALLIAGAALYVAALYEGITLITVAGL